MAGVAKYGRNSVSLFKHTPLIASSVLHRSASTKIEQDAKETPESADEKQGLLSRIFPVRKIDPGRESHSTLLSEKDNVYELQNHAVKPESMEKYLNEFKQFVDTVHMKKTGAQLAGSWTVEIGDQDEAIHLWKYPGGYPVLNKATEIYRTDQEFVDFRRSRNMMLRSRKNQILLPFSFWGPMAERQGNNIYELRSYVLKPGTMIEWGNNWAKGIKYRQECDEAVGGFFSHIGELYNVHHMWAYSSMQERDRIRDNVWHHPSWSDCVARTAYESLQSRKSVRESSWRRPGWDDCVAHTVPLIRHMTARILIPTPFSPLQ